MLSLEVMRQMPEALIRRHLHMEMATALRMKLGWPAGEAEDDEDAADLGALAAASISGAAPALSDSSVTSQARTCAA